MCVGAGWVDSMDALVTQIKEQINKTHQTLTNDEIIRVLKPNITDMINYAITSATCYWTSSNNKFLLQRLHHLQK